MPRVVRSQVLAAALSLGLVACGGAAPGHGEVDPAGTDHLFVASRIDIPTSSAEAQALGLDIDGKPNDGVDNQLGSVLASLAALAPSLDQQAALDDLIDRGKLVVLANVKATDLGSARDVGLTVYTGLTGATDIAPPACLDANDAVCRHQFTGTATFRVDATAPVAEPLAGNIYNGTFTGAGPDLAVEIALFGAPLILPLEQGHAEITGVTAIGWANGKLGGAVRMTEFNARVLPAMGNGIRTTFAMDCAVGGTPPSCGCPANSNGATLANLFDQAPQNCTISDAEVTAVFGSLATPDIDLDDDGTNDAISIGFGVRGVGAVFTLP